MELLASINYRDPLWIAIAFAFGALVRLIGLPPLVGFLLAGFGLNYFGAQGGDFLNEMADLGVTLLLFTIGLKLKVKDLLHTEVWATALGHLIIFTGISAAYLLAFQYLQLPLFEHLSLTNALIIGFALSFSSTVFVVKTLESEGDFAARFGQIAIGVLIIQDLAAVAFLGFSEAKMPSIWAAVLIILLLVARPLLIKLLEKIGHGELQLLFGLTLALGGASLFEAVDMKADLGALVFGVLLAHSTKAEELAKVLFGIKELFLVGFFLSIGMAGLPDLNTLIIVPLLLILIFIKSGLFFWLFSKFKVSTFSATKASLALGNYSEFGLIVAMVAVSKSMIGAEWLVIMAVLVSASFAISAIINNFSSDIYSRFQQSLASYQHEKAVADEDNIELANIKVLVFGMGRVGVGAYEYLNKENTILGLDFDEEVVDKHQKAGRKVLLANVTAIDFWNQLGIRHSAVEWILLCAPNLQANITTAKLAREWGFTGFISAAAKYEDEEEELLANGVNTVFNIYAEAGVGLAITGQEHFLTYQQQQGKINHKA